MARKKSTTRRRRVVTRHGIRRPRDTGETLEQLKKKHRATSRPGGAPQGGVENIKRSSICVAEGVFQWRAFGRNRIRSDDHILEMARAVRETGALEPILVVPIERHFYVVDGHHRLAAYDTAGWTKAIPARVFTGALEDAFREALRRNSRTQLPMTKAEKINAAWTIVKKNDPRDSISTTMALTGVAKGTVNAMRAVRDKLAVGTAAARRELANLSWPQARAKANGWPQERGSEDWREVMAEKVIDKLLHAKLIGDLTKHPDVTALVLSKLDEKLPALLTAEWGDEIERPFDPHEEAGDLPEF